MLGFVRVEDPRVYLLIKMKTQLEDTQIIKISGSDSLDDAYMIGRFCPHCRTYNQCTNVPALRARGVDEEEIESFFQSNLIKQFDKLMFLNFLFDILSADEDFEEDEEDSEEDEDDMPPDFPDDDDEVESNSPPPDPEDTIDDLDDDIPSISDTLPSSDTPAPADTTATDQ